MLADGGHDHLSAKRARRRRMLPKGAAHKHHRRVDWQGLKGECSVNSLRNITDIVKVAAQLKANGIAFSRVVDSFLSVAESEQLYIRNGSRDGRRLATTSWDLPSG
jgi:hypothetical protein